MLSGCILVVDDDPTMLASVAELLELEGYSVATATNGALALELVRQVRPRLVLLDMRMPVLDGWGFARALREAGDQVPIIVMTAASDTPVWAEEVGASGHLAKPFEADDLIAAVARAWPPPEFDNQHSPG